MDDSNGLVATIQARQKKEDLSLTEMAQRLGITASYLCMIYGGHRVPGRKFLKGALAAYPDLQDKVAIFLSAYIAEVNNL